MDFIQTIRELQSLEKKKAELKFSTFEAPAHIPYEVASYMCKDPDFKEILESRYGQDPTQAGYCLLSQEMQQIRALERRIRKLEESNVRKD